MLASEIRRMAEEPTTPTVSQEEIDKQKEEFFVKGGEVKEVPVGTSAYDYASTGKPGDTYGKNIPTGS